MDLFRDPGSIVERQVVTRGRVDRGGAVPATGNFHRASWIDQSVPCTGQHQHRNRRHPWRAKPRGGNQLSKGVPHPDWPGLADGHPIVDQVLRWLHTAAGELENELLPPFRGWREEKSQQGRPSSRTQPVVQRTEGAETGIDQHTGTHFSRVFPRPGCGHHRPHGHRQQVIGRCDPQSRYFQVTVGGHSGHGPRASHGVEFAVSGQLHRDQAIVREGLQSGTFRG